MVRQAARRHGHAIIAALLFSLVVAIAVEQRGVDELALLQLDNIVDIDQFVVPGIERDDLARVVGKEIRDGTGLHRCHDLLPLWRKGRDAELDLVAACLFVIGDDFLIAVSSSGTKPCGHHTSAVIAAALAIYGWASAPTVMRPKESQMSERRVSLAMVVSFPVHAQPWVGGLMY